MTFDSFLNATIPWMVLVVGLFLLYRPLKKPIDGLFGLIGKLIGWGKNKINPQDEEAGLIDQYRSISYE